VFFLIKIINTAVSKYKYSCKLQAVSCKQIQNTASGKTAMAIVNSKSPETGFINQGAK